MSTRTFLAAAALAASVWAGGGTAHAAPGSAYGAQSTPSADTGAANATQLPGGADRPSSFTRLREQALAAMETLREEIATLTALRDAQAALLAWNRETPRHRGTPRYGGTPRYPESTKSGSYLETLSAALCEDPAIGAWCPLLPATFGTGKRTGTPTAEDGHD